MKGLKDTLANLSRLRDRFGRLLSSASKRGGSQPTVLGRLPEVVGFGSNPGNLRMFAHVPKDLGESRALVVALHGCTQTAAVYDHGSGWSTLADAHGFAVLFPEQQRANNLNNCFNWFLAPDTRRDDGEALSIRQMIERMIRDHAIDRRRVFIVGLSAGAAMTSAMLSIYPDVFAGGAIIAGLPYGSARNVQEAFQAMAKGSDRTARAWGDVVRNASDHRGSWPKISIWHGLSDAIVNPSNMEDALKQWIDVHGVPVRPRIEHTIEGHLRRVWRTEVDEDVIEAVSIAGMGHGVPLASSQGVERCGNAGAFHFDVGVSSSHHILRFWGVANNSVAVVKKPAKLTQPLVPAQDEIPSLAARESASNGEERYGTSPGNWQRHDPRPVIEAALKAAGLLSETSAQQGASNPLDPRQIITGTLRSVGLLRR